MEQDWNVFFETLQEFLESERDFQPVGLYAQQVRVLPSTRTLPSWSNVEIQYDQTNETMDLLVHSKYGW